jgi:Uma2 family endonuclease
MRDDDVHRSHVPLPSENGRVIETRAIMETRMHLDPVVLPDSKPAYEWVRGRALQKMSPSRSHAIMQRVFLELLHTWADRRGWVGSEWRFIISPPGEMPRSLVPDVAYIAAEKLAPLSAAEREYPPVAPDIVVEILSPGDQPADVAHKRDVYLSAGVRLVLIVDPLKRTLIAASSDDVTSADGAAIVEPAQAHGLTINLGAVFAQLDQP